MSGEALYERYKDALRRGHVASLRGRLEDALMAYAEAATIAPERATPHTSAGTALMRRKRPADALRHYGVALSLVPRDEAALLGRAQALAALDRRPEAADAYDTLAEVREVSGRLDEAVDAARRGLELAEGRERRRRLERLIKLLRTSEPGEPAREALDQALRVLEGVAMSQNLRPPIPDATAGILHAGPGGSSDMAGAPSDRPADEAVVAAPPRAALDRDLPDDLDLVALADRVDAGLEAGAAESLELVLDLASAYQRRGQVNAALDVCYRALVIDPDAVSLHLAIVELYDERGWSSLATEKLALLDRVADLDADEAAAGLVAAERTRRG